MIETTVTVGSVELGHLSRSWVVVHRQKVSYQILDDENRVKLQQKDKIKEDRMEERTSYLCLSVVQWLERSAWARIIVWSSTGCRKERVIRRRWTGNMNIPRLNIYIQTKRTLFKCHRNIYNVCLDELNPCLVFTYSYSEAIQEGLLYAGPYQGRCKRCGITGGGRKSRRGTNNWIEKFYISLQPIIPKLAG